MDKDQSVSINHNDMFQEIINRLDSLNTKIELCCDKYDEAAQGIQKAYRGHTSGRNTRRTMKPNITQSLFNMGGDFSHIIEDKLSEIKKVSIPKSELIIGRGSKWSGLYLHEALFNILITDVNYNIDGWGWAPDKRFRKDFKRWFLENINMYDTPEKIKHFMEQQNIRSGILGGKKRLIKKKRTSKKKILSKNLKNKKTKKK